MLRHRNYNLLWAGQGISQFGSHISAVAIPLLAIETLAATAGDMGVLGALARLPFLLFIVAGVVVDRAQQRRRVLIGTDLARAALLVLVCVATFTDLLSLWLLGLVLFLSMTLSVLFDTAYMSYLPSIIDRSDLMTGNSRMEATRAAGQIAGPSAGGVLVQAITAPVTILVDALSYVTSAAFLSRISTAEPPRAADQPGRGLKGVGSDIADGVRFVVRHPLLRPLAIAIAVENLVWGAEMALYFLFLARELEMSAGLIGVTLAAAGPGALIGSAFAGWTQRRLGLAGAIIGGLFVFASGAMLIPTAPDALPVAVPMLLVAGFLMSLGGQVCVVNVYTIRQAVTPDALQGRVNASFNFLILGVSQPLGALAGGYLAQAIGIRELLYIAISGMFIGPLLLLASPFRGIREIPASEGDGS